MRLCASLIVFVLGSACAAAQSGAKWDYAGKTGPLAWGKLDPAYQACSKGRDQSPIDIHGAHLNKKLQPIEFHYIGASLDLENTGNLIVAHVRPGSYIVADGVRYDLQQFEFHHPSETAVNGKLTDMDVELLHKSSDGKMAVIEVRMALDRGAPNAVLAMLWPHLPKAGAKENVTDMVNPRGFLPADQGYWTYAGSLTTPPCTEGVRWFVLENEISVSLDQIRAYTYLFRLNSRPLQDTHGRRIEANE
ncbi:carbonic anhydrase [Occallatibacter savannae]|uniref:carbonic anhydrase n=1 Tax=Occallatibacter savannae TaxID=1002691 RepID=UPI000D69C1C1|nr:carbonic anhydrase family protein [Occallatibacter savannae]